jgi:murein DD-endopeptidase MepM/ murein hydrolase activator NlpD
MLTGFLLLSCLNNAWLAYCYRPVNLVGRTSNRLAISTNQHKPFTKKMLAMKKIICSFMLLVGTYSVFAQTEKEGSKTVANQFEQYYNVDSFAAIFNLFDAAMQQALPLNKTVEFLTGLKAQAGKITRRSFVRYEQSYASYKTNFERALFAVNISLDDHDKINGLFVKPFKESNIPKPSKNTTLLALPFKGEWTVIWGGDTKELNYHVENEAQKNAFDIVVTDGNNRSYKTDGKTNEDYYAFGKELTAPCSGEVVLVVDGVKENIPGELNPVYVPGNTVIIKTAQNEYLFFAHFKQHSIKVKQGQVVKQGDALGLCGNSGNSSEPHLHFHIQNTENMAAATGIKCYFSKLVVNGQSLTNYSPVKKDKIRSE